MKFVISAKAEGGATGNATSVQGKFYQKNGLTTSMGKNTAGGRGKKLTVVKTRKSVRTAGR